MAKHIFSQGTHIVGPDGFDITVSLSVELDNPQVFDTPGRGRRRILELELQNALAKIIQRIVSAGSKSSV